MKQDKQRDDVIRKGLETGKMCVQVLIAQGGAMATELLEEELPVINRAIAALSNDKQPDGGEVEFEGYTIEAWARMHKESQTALHKIIHAWRPGILISYQFINKDVDKICSIITEHKALQDLICILDDDATPLRGDILEYQKTEPLTGLDFKYYSPVISENEDYFAIRKDVEEGAMHSFRIIERNGLPVIYRSALTKGRPA